MLHIYDHTYYRDGDHLYSYGAFNRESWERYLEHFEELTILANFSDKTDLDFTKLNKVERNGVNFRFTDNHRKIGIYLRSFIFPKDEVKELVYKHDAVIIRLPSELGYVGVKICRQLGKPYALEVVGCPWDAYWNHGSFAGKILAPLSRIRMRFAIKKSSFVLYVTRQYLQTKYPTVGISASASNVMLEEGITENVLKSHLEKLKELGQGIRPMRLGLIGSFNVRYKGHKELLHAISRIKGSIPAFEILFVGMGDSGWIERLASKVGLLDNLRIVGRLQMSREVFDFLDTIDLYIHPSKQEGLPRSLIEAMSRGCPCLASSVAGIPELLESKYLHVPGDYLKLGEQIQAVIQRSGELQNMAHQNFMKAKEYCPEVLRQYRSDFWSKFKQYVLTK